MIAPSSPTKQKLSLGCACLSQDDDGGAERSADRKDLAASSSVRLAPFLVLHIPASKSKWLLCRLIGASSRILNSRKRLRCSDSVHVLGIETVEDWTSLLDVRFLPNDLNVELLPKSSTDTDQYSLRLKSPHEIQKPESDSLSHRRIYLGTMIQTPATPLLSLSLRLLHASPAWKSETLDPLLLSCLKRQLVGALLVVSGSSSTGKIRTRVRVDNVMDRTWTFETRSASRSSSSSNNNTYETPSRGSAYLGVIFPSTRITIYEDDKDGKLESAEQESTAETKEESMGLSAPAKMLVDTIRCVTLQRNPGKEDRHNTGNVPLNLPRSFLFSGPPGVGKTFAVRQAVESMNAANTSTDHKSVHCHLISIQGSELLGVAGHPALAAKALEKHFLQAAQKSLKGNICLIFLDECDALLTTDPVAYMLGHLLDRMDSYEKENIPWRRILVVAATNRIDAIPSYLRRPGRFDREIPFAPPNAADRKGLLKSLLYQTPSIKESDIVSGGVVDESSLSEKDIISDEALHEIAELTVGYVAADLGALVRKAALLLSTSRDEEVPLPASLQSRNLSMSECLMRAMEFVGASCLRDAAMLTPPTTTWDDVAGDAGGAKTALRQTIEWPRTRSRAYQLLGLTTPKGILLHGPPGCAKTSLARAAAGASGVAFLSFSPADVYASSYVGEAEAIVRRAFSLARSAAPCILFFDEIDAILGADSMADHGMARGSSAEARVLSTFLNEMDGVDGSWKDGVLVLGATNRPGTIDAALLRPGRFDKIIYVPPPDFDGRRSIFEMQCSRWKVSKDDPIDVDALADETISGFMTGAEIKGACHEAALRAFRDNLSQGGSGIPEMKQSYLLESLRNVHALLSNPDIIVEFRSFEDRRKQTARTVD